MTLKELPKLRIVAYSRPPARDHERLATHGALPVDEIVDEPTWPFDPMWFYAYIDNCFDPARYIVRGGGNSIEAAWLDAYERLLCHPRIERELDINRCWGADEVADAQRKLEAGEGVSGTEFNENGLLLDTESLQLWANPVRVRIERVLELVAV